MCTVLLLHRPGHAFPVLIAANRDERLDRAWDPPGAWWPDRPGVVGGRDRTAGGTWMAAEPRRGGGDGAESAGQPGAGARQAVARRTAAAGAGRRGRPRRRWRRIGRLPAARVAALQHGGGGPAGRLVPARHRRRAGRRRCRSAPGLHMVTAHDPNDLGQPAHRPPPAALPRRAGAAARTGDWAAWEAPAGRCRPGGRRRPRRCGCRRPVASARSRPACWRSARRRRCDWRFAAGAAGAAPFLPVTLA